MTISSSTRKAGPFTGNGVTTVFPFEFKVFAAADLLVVQANTTTGVESTKVLTTDYTVTLNGNQNTSPGGTITMLVAPAVGFTLTATSQVASQQPVDLTNAGGFYPRVINDALDRVTILAQQIMGLVGRSIKIPLSDTALSTTLPTAAKRANKALVFDANGNVGVGVDNYSDQAAGAAASAEAAANSAAAANGSAVAGTASAAAASGSAFAAATSAAQALTSEINAQAVIRVYATPAEGVDPVKGVPVGEYFDVRSALSDTYLDVWRNVDGTPVFTGKSYPSGEGLRQDLIDMSTQLTELSTLVLRVTPP